MDSVSRFSDLPCLCDTSVIVRGRQRTGSPGVDGAGRRVGSITLCMMDVARGTGHLKCTKQDAPVHTRLSPFAASPLPMFNSPSVCLSTATETRGVFLLYSFWAGNSGIQRKFKDSWCLLAKSSLGLSIPEMVSKNQSKAMAHLLFPFIMK